MEHTDLTIRETVIRELARKAERASKAGGEAAMAGGGAWDAAAVEPHAAEAEQCAAEAYRIYEAAVMDAPPCGLGAVNGTLWAWVQAARAQAAAARVSTATTAEQAIPLIKAAYDASKDAVEAASGTNEPWVRVHHPRPWSRTEGTEHSHPAPGTAAEAALSAAYAAYVMADCVAEDLGIDTEKI